MSLVSTGSNGFAIISKKYQKPIEKWHGLKKLDLHANLWVCMKVTFEKRLLPLMEIKEKVMYMSKSLKLVRTNDIFWKWQHVLRIGKNMHISLEVSQKLKAMKNDWYFIGFYRVWWPLKKSCKTAAARTKVSRWPKCWQRKQSGPQSDFETFKCLAL